MTRHGFPPLPALRAFHAAARLGRFNLAAAELELSESAISHQVRKLENLVHVQLFHRNGPRVSLTADGARYFERIDPALQAIAEATRALAGPTERSRVVLTVPASLASFWLIPRLADLESTSPGIDLQLVTTPRVVDLRREQVDLAIRHGRGHWPGVDAQFLLAESAMPVCSPGHVEPCEPGDSPAVFAARRLIVNLFYPEEWTEWARSRGIEPPNLDGALRLDSIEQVIVAAEGGLGIGIGRRPLVDERLTRGALIAPFGGAQTSATGYYLCQASNLALNTAAWKVAQWLKGCA